MKNIFYNLTCSLIIVIIFINLCNSFRIIADKIETKENIKTIIIDAGHGGEDGGTVSKDGTLEKDINLEIALHLKNLFEANDFKVIMTREEDTDLCDKSLTTVASRKKSDIIKRTETCNNSNAALVLSIHQNYFEETKYSGAQMFYGKSENSKELAEFLQEEIKNKLQPSNNREIKHGDSIYLLEHVNKPIVIVECGFLSNEEDLSNLKDKEYIKSLSFVIYMATNKYLDSLS